MLAVQKIEIYRWEDDPDGEEIVETLKERKRQFTDHILDAEDPNAESVVFVDGKSVGDCSDYLDMLDNEDL